MTVAQKPKPLAGWRVLVPRGGRWGDTVAATLRGYGAVPVIAPLINFASTDDAQTLANAFYELQDGQFDWLVVTSATTVDVLAILEAGCAAPVGAHGQIDDGLLFLDARVYSPDGAEKLTSSHALYVSDTQDPGREVAERVAAELLENGAAAFASVKGSE